MTEPDERDAQPPVSGGSGRGRSRGGLDRLRQSQETTDSTAPPKTPALPAAADAATAPTDVPQADSEREAAAPEAGSEAPSAQAPSPQAPPEPANHRRRPAPVLLALAVVLALVVIALGIAVGKTAASASNSQASPLQEQFDRRAAATSAARQFAVNFFTYDYHNLDRDLKRVVDQSTGAFQKDYISKEPQLKVLLPKAKVVATAKITEAGVSLLAKDQAIVLVTADQTVNNLVNKNGQNRYRLKLTMQQTPQGWLAADVTPVV